MTYKIEKYRIIMIYISIKIEIIMINPKFNMNNKQANFYQINLISIFPYN